MSIVISKSDPSAEGSQITKIPMAEIFADTEFNCRGEIIPHDVMELARNIQEQGLIQPIIVQPYSKGPAGTNYRVVAGYRRHMAHRVNKSPAIDCIIREGLSDTDAKLLNLSENLARQDLDLMQEAHAIKNLVDKGLTQQMIADKLNVSRGWVQSRVYALRLAPEIQEEIKNKWIKTEHIHAMKDMSVDEQIEFTRQVKELKQNEGKRVRVAVSKKKLSKDTKKKMRRDVDQINKMIDHLIDTVGANLATRVLAWATGNVSSSEIFDDLEKEMDERGDYYDRPLEDF
jgi:ParB/RepB/Spo0J family partition protein